jgi:hypothetical protein
VVSLIWVASLAEECVTPDFRVWRNLAETQSSERALDADNPLECERCGGAMVFVGRISMPRQVIYGCEVCGQQVWLLSAAPTASTPVKRPQAQQQMQQQPQSQQRRPREPDGAE